MKRLLYTVAYTRDDRTTAEVECRTKGRAQQKLMVWKRWQERKGLETRGTKADPVASYVSIEGGMPTRAAVLRSYDPETKTRIT